MLSQHINPPFEVAPGFAGLPVVHGFFGRRGGVSTGPYESLTAGFLCGDDPDCVAQNRARIAAALKLDPGRLVSVKQIHSNRCVVVDGLSDVSDIEADAMVSTVPGLGLGVVTADCAPVLFAAQEVVGAAHAGWKGALGGVLENTLAAMEGCGAVRSGIRAAIGPCIAQRHYEVSAGFETPFLAEDAYAERFFMEGARPDKLMFDLPGYCAYRLTRAGVARVDLTGADTFALEDVYFSHRRTTLAGGSARGLQLSVVALSA